jgi:hypothetical protein
VTADGKVVFEGGHAWDRWNARHFAWKRTVDGDIKVGYALYGTFNIAFLENYANGNMRNLDVQYDVATRDQAVRLAKESFNVDTAVMTFQFLMFEPGAKLSYVGPVPDDAGNNAAYDELKVVFADPIRAGLEFHPIVDRATSMLVRIELFRVGATQKAGYVLKDWTTVAGLRFATARTNLGYAGETVAIKEIRVSAPDDSLFIAPL